MNEAVNAIVSAIKNKKGKVISFIQSHGGSIKKSDTDITIGKELTKVLSVDKKNIEDFVALIEGNSFIPVLVSGIASLVGGSKEAKLSEQQGQDAITLALINAGIAKQETNWPLIISLSVMGIVIIIVGILVFKKYNK